MEMPRQEAAEEGDEGAEERVADPPEGRRAHEDEDADGFPAGREVRLGPGGPPGRDRGRRGTPEAPPVRITLVAASRALRLAGRMTAAVGRAGIIVEGATLGRP